MHYFTIGFLSFSCILFGTTLGVAQQSSGACDLFEEESGLVVIEMESLPLSANWEIAQDIPGYTGGGYIQWTGNQYFNQVGRGPIRFQVKINMPGTYTFNWRVAVGSGTERSEHNDSWLKIIGDHLIGRKGNNSSALLKPKPICTTDPDFDCPNGSSRDGFFKVYGGGVNEFIWRANTSDHDAHDVLARFDTAGVYTFVINARSSFHCIDRMILWRINTQRRIDAERIFNQRSPCLTDMITSIEEQAADMSVLLYPNPTSNDFWIEFDHLDKRQIIFSNVLGQEIQNFQTLDQKLNLDVSSLPAGIYWLEIRQKNRRTRQKLVVR